MRNIKWVIYINFLEYLLEHQKRNFSPTVKTSQLFNHDKHNLLHLSHEISVRTPYDIRIGDRWRWVLSSDRDARNWKVEPRRRRRINI